MKIGSRWKKGTAALLVAFMMLNISGCSDLLKGIAADKASKYTASVMESFVKSPRETLDANSLAEIEYPELTEDQEKLVNDYISSAEYEIGEVQMNDKRTKGTVEIRFFDCPVFDDTFVMGTMDEVTEQLSDLKSDVSVELTVKRTDDHKWIFEDLSGFVDVLMTPYQEICFLDDDGNPINVTAGYIDLVYVDCAWYDPLMNNPVATNRLAGTDYLKVVFYFSRPMTMDLHYELIHNNGVSESADISLENDITADCHFTAQNAFEGGSYQIILYYGDTVIAESETMTVA